MRRDEIDRLVPILNADYAVVTLATSYGIPEKHIDKSKLEEINLFDHARIRMYQGAGGRARQSAPGDKAPGPKGAKAAVLNEKI